MKIILEINGKIMEKLKENNAKIDYINKTNRPRPRHEDKYTKYSVSL